MKSTKHLLCGSSISDPLWQTVVPWTVHYSKIHPSYIVAKAGVGIKGISVETINFLRYIEKPKKIVFILPDIFRVDIQLDKETYQADAMVDLLYAENGDISTKIPAERKWAISGSVNFDRKNSRAKIFDFCYKQKGLLVIAEEHFFALRMLIDYCKINDIDLIITAGIDPLEEIKGLDYIRDEFIKLLEFVEYENWLKFEDKFIFDYLGNNRLNYHPDTEKQKLIADYIINNA